MFILIKYHVECVNQWREREGSESHPPEPRGFRIEFDIKEKKKNNVYIYLH